MRKLLMLLVAVLFVAGCLTGCGSKPADDTNKPPAEEDTKDAGDAAKDDVGDAVDDAKDDATKAVDDTKKKVGDLKKGLTDK